MDARELEAYLHAHIPLSAAMQVAVVAVSHDAVNQEVLAALDPGLGDPDDIEQDNGCFNVLQWSAGDMVVLSVNEHPDGT